MKKRAYVGVEDPELAITIVRNPQIKVSIRVDFLSPKVPQFSIEIPIAPEATRVEILAIISVGMDALREQIVAHFLSFGFSNDTCLQLAHGLMDGYDKIMTGENQKVSLDPTMQAIEQWDGGLSDQETTFEVPEAFLSEFYNRIVTAKRVIDRNQPKKFRMEMINRPVPTNTRQESESAKVIRQYRNKTQLTQPGPLFVVVYDISGKPIGTTQVNKNNLRYNRV